MVSVCIPSYNGENFIEEQLNSILIQLQLTDEIIISDDSSTDRTIEVVKSLNDKRITILENCKFKSPIFNLENALKYAKGDYIFLADQDDIWLPEKVKIVCQQLLKFDIVLHDCHVTDSNLAIVNESFFDFNLSKKGLFYNLRRNSYIGCCMAFNRKILNKCLPFPKDIPLHDLWIGFVGSLFFRTSFIKVPLIYYRRHENVFSHTGYRSKFNWKRKIMFRVNCLKYIPFLLFR